MFEVLELVLIVVNLIPVVSGYSDVAQVRGEDEFFSATTSATSCIRHVRFADGKLRSNSAFGSDSDLTQASSDGAS